MIRITFGKRSTSGPIKAPMSMPARMFLALQRGGLAHPDYPRAFVLQDGIRIIEPTPHRLTTVAGILFSLTHHPRHMAGHYPHSRKTPEHVVEVTSDAQLGAVCSIFKRWPRVRVTKAGVPETIV